MSDESPTEGAIQPPKPNRVADIGRVAAKGVLGAVPVAGSLLAEAAGEILPDPTKADRQRWEGQVTDGVNNLHGRVDELDQRTGSYKVTLEGGAAYAAKYLAENCPDGMGTYFTAKDVQQAYPDMSLNDIEDGLADLESYGFAEAYRTINGSPRFRLTGYGYRVLDPPIMGWNPGHDARQIAALVAQKRDGSRASDLEAALGWPRRRFNPALRIVLDYISPGRVSGEIQADYVARWFSPNEAERATLRRFAAGE